MSPLDKEKAAALAAADRQLALVKDTLAHAVREAKGLLFNHGETEAWALLGMNIKRQLECAESPQHMAAEMLALAAIQLAKLP